MLLKDKFKHCLHKLRSKENNQVVFNYISESPIAGNDDNPLSFGHTHIVNTLKEMVSNCPESFTIGLYGDWGSGKSTIAYTLRDNLKKESVPLVIFDVWKHEGDALRRTFLREVHHFFKTDELWNKKYHGKDNLLDELTKTKKSSVRQPINFFKTIKFSLIFVATVSLLPVVAWLILDKILGIFDFKKNDLVASIIAFISLFPISFLLKFVLQFIEKIKGEKVEFFEDKIQDPIEFETLFKKMLLNLDKDIKKVVFVFDNLDRVSGEKAIQIMATIKTFLDPIDRNVKEKEIVFLIPCDETSIKRHLKQSLNYSKNFKGDEYHQHASEYLRKFFNTILWIPDFYVNELEKLASEKLEETKIEDFKNARLAALIVLVFDKNPRQIIQFINILISNYLLIKQKPIAGFSLKNDIPQLAKYLLLIQKFPDIMEAYKNTLTQNLDGLPTFLNEETNGVRRFTLKRVTDFQNFLSLTEHVRIESLDLFFKFRRSDFEAKFENSIRLIKLIETNKINDLLTSEDMDEETKKEDLKYLSDLNLEKKSYEFSQVVNEKLRNTNNPILITKFINGVFILTNLKSITLEEDSYRLIYSKLEQSREHISEIEPKLLNSECFSKISSKYYEQKIKDLVTKQQVKDFITSHPTKD